jgi:tetratricopeptide (TPR) repeat protein
MFKPALKCMAILLVLACCLAGPALAQSENDLAARLNAGYEMLEKGELDRARQLYEEMLRQYPGNPVALNNLAAILARQGKYEEALRLLTEALDRARGYRVFWWTGCATWRASARRCGWAGTTWWAGTWRTSSSPTF